MYPAASIGNRSDRWAVSRVLYHPYARGPADVATIDLSRLVTKTIMQPTRESNGSISLAINGASSSSSLLGLAPGGVYTAIAVARDAGGLLHHLFTLAPSRAPCGAGMGR